MLSLNTNKEINNNNNKGKSNVWFFLYFKNDFQYFCETNNYNVRSDIKFNLIEVMEK